MIIQIYIESLCFYYETKKYSDNLKNAKKKPCHSSVKWSNPGNFLKAQFVIFRCRKYIRKGYIEMRK